MAAFSSTCEQLLKFHLGDVPHRVRPVFELLPGLTLSLRRLAGVLDMGYFRRLSDGSRVDSCHYKVFCKESD